MVTRKNTKNENNSDGNSKKISLAEVYLQNILQNLPEPIYWLDRNSVILGCNDPEAKIFGYDKSAELVGKSILDIARIQNWKPGVAEALVQNDQEIMRTGQAKSVEEIDTAPTGELRSFLTHKAPLYDESQNVIGIIGTSINITQLKNTQKALDEQIKKTEKAYRSKGEFLTTVSHEIRNPISNVITYQNLVKNELDKLQEIFFESVIEGLANQGKADIVQKISDIFQMTFEYFSTTQAESHRSLNALINLASLHRMQVNGVQPKFEMCNVKKLLEDSIAESTYPNYGKIHVQVQINSELSENINLDYNNVKEALKIIVGNAIRFSHDNGRVKIKADNLSENQQKYLIVSVQDFGEGISAEQLENIFETSLSDEKTSKESIYRKPSIQLPQAKMWVEASSGYIDIKSILKQGTIVTLKIPYEAVQDNLNQEVITQKQGCNILLIEDDLVIQKATLLELIELKHRVDIASNGKDAIKFALENDYDVALLDISLPDISGLEVMRVVRSKKEDQIIFIGVTSHATEEDEEYFIEQGAMTVLKKPVSKQILKSTIHAALKVKASLNE